ncbi:PP2C family protein-serine/threonine phosphatase [Thermincola ferriacetica]
MKKLWALIIILGVIVTGTLLFISNDIFINQLAFACVYLLLSLINLESDQKMAFSLEVSVLAYSATSFAPDWALFTAFLGGIIKGIYEQFRLKKPLKEIIFNFSTQVFATLTAGHFLLQLQKSVDLTLYTRLLVFLVIFFTASIFVKLLYSALLNEGRFTKNLFYSVKFNLLSMVGIGLVSLVGTIVMEEKNYLVFLLVFFFLLYLQYIIDGLVKEHNRNLYLSQLIISMLNQDLELIRDMYAKLLPAPKQTWGNLDIFAFNCPAEKIGGDFYDFIPLSETLFAFVIGDVMGHGMKAAIQVNNTMFTIRALLRGKASPGDCLTELNKISCSYLNKTKQFFTVFLGVYDTSEKILRFANGGHLPPIVYKQKPGRAEFLRVEGPAVGFLSNYQYREGSCSLEPGDILVLYTDGLPEILSGINMRNGSKILQFVQQHADQPGFYEALKNEVELLAGKNKDDVTFTLIIIH